MFTGIIEGLGSVKAINRVSRGAQIFVTSDFILKGSKIGDSIAVNGVCLTAVEIFERSFVADVSPETLDKTVLGKIKAGDKVNLERALKLSDRLDGHIVSGHVDGLGQLISVSRLGNAIILRFKVPESLTRYMIKKGSVAVDGTSLTINDCDDKSFEVSIIPHTAGLTTVAQKKTGDMVNIETDMIGKYVEKLLSGIKSVNDDKPGKRSAIDLTMLKKSGFL